MSETSSDTESSCGWTIISNEGSDIETLGPEASVEYGAGLEHPPVGETQLQDSQASASAADCVEEENVVSLDDTVVEQTVPGTLCESQDGHNATEEALVTLLSSSDHSDIVTLDSKERVHVEEEEEEEEEGAAGEELYLGTSCSSQYTFTAADTGKQPAVTTSSSSEDEEGRSGTTVVRRRRLRKNTACIVTEPEEEELDSSQHEEEEDAGQLEMQTSVKGPSALGVQHVKDRSSSSSSSSSSTLNKCIMVALIIAVSMGFGHFHGTVQIQERQKTTEKVRLSDLDGVKDLLQRHVALTDRIQNVDDLDEQVVISLLADVAGKLQKENQKLSSKQAQIQVQRDTEIRQLEAMEAGADSLLSENQKLKNQLEREKQLAQNFQNQKQVMMAEAQTLRMKMDQERKATDELQAELKLLRSRLAAADERSLSEAEELQSRLKELENKLRFEQQRSDLWERLYLETKNERAKGDTEAKVKRPRSTVKETFDAVKNSTKEFVYHHKEQIKKAKEAVKENLRKFSDSVKSTFRNFKNSASTFFGKARDFYDGDKNGKKTKDTWQHRVNRPSHKASHPFQDGFRFQSGHATRKSGGHANKDPNPHKSHPKGCSGVFDCAYQESMSLFNEAMEPIKADEFNQLLRSYVQQQAQTFHRWKDLEAFINSFFNNGFFVHDRMLFTDFVSDVGDYLSEIYEDRGVDEDVFRGFEDYIYRHVFGEAYLKTYHPNGPFQGPDSSSKEARAKPQHRRQQRAKARPPRERKWSRSEKNADRNMADVKIELGPLPFDPKY